MGGSENDNDTIHLTNGVTDKIGILVDGNQGATDWNDKSFTGGPGTVLTIGNFTPSVVFPGKVIAFTPTHPPTIWPEKPEDHPLKWTPGSDSVDIIMQNEYAIPVYFRIVTGDFETRRIQALEGIIKTMDILQLEAQGIRLSVSDDQPFDDTKNLNSLKHKDFTICSETIKIDIGSKPNESPPGVVIYYIDSVFNDPFGGYWCPAPENFIVIGNGASHSVLTHELGHALYGPDHIDCLSTSPHSQCSFDGPEHFDRSNVMHSAPEADRKGLTEGQTFRGIFNPGSVINSLYNARPGLITAQAFCGGFSTEDTKPDCPPVQKRIWEDEGEEDAMGNKMMWPPN